MGSVILLLIVQQLSRLIPADLDSSFLFLKACLCSISFTMIVMGPKYNKLVLLYRSEPKSDLPN